MVYVELYNQMEESRSRLDKDRAALRQVLGQQQPQDAFTALHQRIAVYLLLSQTQDATFISTALNSETGDDRTTTANASTRANNINIHAEAARSTGSTTAARSQSCVAVYAFDFLVMERKRSTAKPRIISAEELEREMLSTRQAQQTSQTQVSTAGPSALDKLLAQMQQSQAPQVRFCKDKEDALFLQPPQPPMSRPILPQAPQQMHATAPQITPGMIRVGTYVAFSK